MSEEERNSAEGSVKTSARLAGAPPLSRVSQLWRNAKAGAPGKLRPLPRDPTVRGTKALPDRISGHPRIVRGTIAYSLAGYRTVVFNLEAFSVLILPGMTVSRRANRTVSSCAPKSCPSFHPTRSRKPGLAKDHRQEEEQCVLSP